MSRAIKRALTVVTVAAAFAAISVPAASARFDLNPSDANQPVQAATPAPVTAPSSPAPGSSSSSGFDWGDAGIGAGVALVLVVLAGGAVLATRRSQTRNRPATTS